MARTAARVQTAIWSDPDFRARTAATQRLYILLISQPTVSFCGVIPYTPRRWAEFAPDTKPAQLAKSLAELETSRYIVIDRRTEELWIRSFVRHDGILTTPQLKVALTRDYTAIQSDQIRHLVIDTLGDGLTDGLTDGFLDRIPNPFAEAYQDRYGKGCIRARVAPDPPASSLLPPASTGAGRPSRPRGRPSGASSSAEPLGGSLTSVVEKLRIAETDAAVGCGNCDQGWITDAAGSVAKCSCQNGSKAARR